VPGVHGIQQPRATLEEEQVDAAALNAAAQYAGEHNSTALIVSRHGHIIVQRYWGGGGRDTVADAGGFARTIAAMLVGIAMDDRHITSVNEPVGSFVESFAAGDRPSMTIRELLQQDDAQPLVTLVEALSQKRYAAFLSRELWKPIAAGDASIVLDGPHGAARANCCFFARQADWLRVAQLLIDDGDYQGARILPKGWTRQMVAASERNPAKGSQLWLGTPRDGFYLAGAGKSRLWLHPALHLAVLRMGTEPKDWDESRIPSLVIAGVIDRPPAPAPDQTDLSKLVPNH
jgi:CubicO group peptidase (beta-lactamase class C family)